MEKGDRVTVEGAEWTGVIDRIDEPVMSSGRAKANIRIDGAEIRDVEREPVDDLEPVDEPNYEAGRARDERYQPEDTTAMDKAKKARHEMEKQSEREQDEALDQHSEPEIDRHSDPLERSEK